MLLEIGLLYLVYKVSRSPIPKDVTPKKLKEELPEEQATQEADQKMKQPEVLDDNPPQKKLLEIIQMSEESSHLRWKSVGWSSLYTGMKFINLVSLGLMVAVPVAGIMAPLTRLGLTSKLSQLWALGGLFFLSKVGVAKISDKTNRSWAAYALKTEHELHLKAFEHVQGLDMSYLDSQNTEKLMNLISSDTDKIKQFLNYTPPTLLEKAGTLGLGALVMMMVSPAAFLLTLLPIPVLTYINRRQRRRTTNKYREVSQYSDQFHQVLANNLHGLPTVRSYTSEEDEFERISETSAHLYNSSFDIEKENSFHNTLNEFTLSMGIVLPLVYGSISVILNQLSLPKFMVQMFVTPKLLTAATGMDRAFSLYYEADQAAIRLTELFQVKPKIIGGEKSLAPEEVRGELVFNKISFSYLDESTLREIDLRIPANHTIAFVGPTGSGKSTLTKLLLRFYDVNDGKIILDGWDIRDFQLKDLRKAIGLVSQDTYLFNGTIYENILYGRPEASHEEVIEACKIAEAYDFIVNLPNGFDSLVGERGQKLSGGQRQRISIARAVLKDPPILVLDEATSSVDNETEAAIQKSIDRISKNRTTIIIAHRLSTVCNADNIYLLQDAQIIESGTHDELIQQNQIYAALWRLQTAEKDPELLQN